MSNESGDNTVENNKTEEDSIIKEQSSTIKTLTEQIGKGESSTQAQPVFLPAAESKPPNYALIGIVGIAIFMFFKMK